MNQIGKTVASAIAGITLAACLAGPAAAVDLRYATGFAPNSTGAKGADAFALKAKEISGGDLNIKVFAQSLLSFTEMNGGVRDKIADTGMVLFPYFPAEFPNSTMISELTMIFAMQDTNNRGALAWYGALIEYMMLNCPSCTEEMKKQNQLFTTTSSTEYMMMCTKPIEKVGDMQGVRIRAPGAHWSRWARSVGATTVAVPQPEMFEAMTAGILDCSLSGAAELIDLSMINAVKYIVEEIPGGGFGGTAHVNVNRDVWAKLTPKQRTDFLKASAYHGAWVSWEYRMQNEAALKAAAAKGIKTIKPKPEFVAATRSFIESDLAGIAKNYTDKYKVVDAEKQIATMRGLFTKWVPLVQKVDSTQSLADLAWKEIYSKIDVTKYGL